METRSKKKRAASHTRSPVSNSNSNSITNYDVTEAKSG